MTRERQDAWEVWGNPDEEMLEAMGDLLDWARLLRDVTQYDSLRECYVVNGQRIDRDALARQITAIETALGGDFDPYHEEKASGERVFFERVIYALDGTPRYGVFVGQNGTQIGKWTKTHRAAVKRMRALARDGWVAISDPTPGHQYVREGEWPQVDR